MPIPGGGILPPSPARTVPIPTIPTVPAPPRPAAFTGRADGEPVPRSVGSNPGEMTTARKGDVAAALEALDETTQVAGPAPDGATEVDLEVEKDVVIEFDDA